MKSSTLSRLVGFVSNNKENFMSELTVLETLAYRAMYVLGSKPKVDRQKRLLDVVDDLELSDILDNSVSTGEKVKENYLI